MLPGEPLLLLCLGVCYINMAMGKKVVDRNRAVLLGFAFLQVGPGLLPGLLGLGLGQLQLQLSPLLLLLARSC